MRAHVFDLGSACVAPMNKTYVACTTDRLDMVSHWEITLSKPFHFDEKLAGKRRGQRLRSDTVGHMITTRKILKFGHTVTGMAFLGAIVVLWVFHEYLAAPGDSLAVYTAQRQVMERIASLVLMPSLMLSLLFGIASLTMVKSFHGAPWAWGKLFTTVLMLEGSLMGIQSPIKKEAALAVSALSDESVIAGLALQAEAEQLSLILIGFVAIANVALGVWRPRFRSKAN